MTTFPPAPLSGEAKRSGLAGEGMTKSNQVCAYLAEQANWLLGRIEIKDGKVTTEGQALISNAKILIAEALGAISVICRDGATEKQLTEFKDLGVRMNSAVRF